MLEVWGRDNSLNVQKVLWCCGELGLTYQRVDAGGSFGRTSEPHYRRLNPTGRVPTIVDGDFSLWESNTIVRYFARAYGQGSLCPDDPIEQAHADMWMDWQATTLWPSLRPLFLTLVRGLSSVGNETDIADQVSLTAAHLEILDAI